MAGWNNTPGQVFVLCIILYCIVFIMYFVLFSTSRIHHFRLVLCIIQYFILFVFIMYYVLFHPACAA